jgi:hypothetical protein
VPDVALLAATFLVAPLPVARLAVFVVVLLRVVLLVARGLVVLAAVVFRSASGYRHRSPHSFSALNLTLYLCVMAEDLTIITGNKTSNTNR